MPAYCKSTKAQPALYTTAQMAHCFGGSPILPGCKQLWSRVAGGSKSEEVGRFQQKWQELLPVNLFLFTLNSSAVQSPSLYNALSPRYHLSLSPSLCGQPLAHSTLPFCCHSCLLAGSLGEWYVWSPEGTESGLRWHVNPGRVSDPQVGEEKAHTKTTSEGGRQGLRFWGWGAGLCAGIQCTDSQTLLA